MRFKLDENLPIELAELFRRSGHDAQTVFDEGLAGAEDAEIASVCVRERRAVVTLDMDFADIRAYPPPEYAGIVVFRLDIRRGTMFCVSGRGSSGHFRVRHWTASSGSWKNRESGCGNELSSDAGERGNPP